MASRQRQLVDAVVTSLNDATFSQAFTAARSYVVVHDLPDLADLTVRAVPAGSSRYQVARTRFAEKPGVHIGIQKKVSPTSQTQIDAMLDLVEEIGDALEGLVMELDGSRAVCHGVADEPLYSPEHLERDGVFTSVIRLQFTLFR